MSVKIKKRLLQNSLRIFSIVRYLVENKFFQIMKIIRKLQKCIYRKSSAKRECHPENVFLKGSTFLKGLYYRY